MHKHNWRTLLVGNQRRVGRTGRALLAGVALATLLVGTSASPAYADVAISAPAGPLTSISITPDTKCAVFHTGDTASEFFGGNACGTFVAVGGTLYGPGSVPAGGSASPITVFTPVSQTGPTGAGTSGDPFTLTTVVGLGATGLQLTEVDSYVAGEETYRTNVSVLNSSGGSVDAIIYRAGDCFLQDSDSGLGSTTVVPAGTAVACIASTGTRIEQWYPLTAGSSYMEDDFDTVWTAIGSQAAFPNTCACASNIDNGAGLSWNRTIAAGATATVSHLTVFSPLGTQPLTTAKTADQASAAAGSADGYTITISNPNASSVTLTSITETLAAGFAYRAGTTTGPTTADPTISSQTLTWSGSFSVPGAVGSTPGVLQLHFGVTVSTTPGTYMDNATAVGTGVTIIETGPTAPVTVTATGPTTTTTTTTTTLPPTNDTSAPAAQPVVATPRFTG